MTQVNKVKNILYNILIWINRCFYTLILSLYITLSYTTPKCTEEYINPDGTSIQVPIRLDYRTLNSQILFIPIVPLFISSLLERKSRRIRYIFISIAFLSILFFFINRILLDCPQEF